MTTDPSPPDTRQEQQPRADAPPDLVEHTPTPWTHGSWGGQCHIKHLHGQGQCIYDPTFYYGGLDISGPNKETVIGSSYDGVEAKESDIRFIVAAVNSYEANKAEIARLRAELDQAREALKPDRRLSGLIALAVAAATPLQKQKDEKDTEFVKRIVTTYLQFEGTPLSREPQPEQPEKEGE